MTEKLSVWQTHATLKHASKIGCRVRLQTGVGATFGIGNQIMLLRT